MDKEVLLGIRPDNISISDKGLPARVDVAEALGGETYLYLECCDAKIIVKLQGTVTKQPDEMVNLFFRPEHIHLFDKESGHNINLPLNKSSCRYTASRRGYWIMPTQKQLGQNHQQIFLQLQSS